LVARKQEREATEARQEANRARWARANKLLAVLRERWPLAFCEPRMPFVIGIAEEIRALLGDEASKATLNLAMHHWTRRPDYIAALARGEMRANLDGSPAGEPTEDERQIAAQRLREIEAREAEAFKSGIDVYKARSRPKCGTSTVRKN
jgi:sRNA-binding protein